MAKKWRDLYNLLSVIRLLGRQVQFVRVQMILTTVEVNVLLGMKSSNCLEWVERRDTFRTIRGQASLYTVTVNASDHIYTLILTSANKRRVNGDKT